MTSEQLEFQTLVEALRPIAAAMQGKAKVRRKLEAVTPERFAVLLNRAASEENVSFSTYALMMAVRSHPARASLASIALETGYSYWAVWNQVERTPWFTKSKGANGLVCLTLSAEAPQKLERISKRIARYV